MKPGEMDFPAMQQEIFRADGGNDHHQVIEAARESGDWSIAYYRFFDAAKPAIMTRDDRRQMREWLERSL